MGFAGADAAELGNVEIYNFLCVPAFFHLPYHWNKESAGSATPEARAVIEAEFEDSLTDQFWEFVYRRYITGFPVAGVLINTCRPIEGEFIDLYQKRQDGGESVKIYAVGPVNPLVTSDSSGETPRHECLEWLDRQPESSVVYVSFGSTCVLPLEQIEQLAAGLKSSGQRFIWVLRDADRGDIFSDGETRELLPGFEKEVEGMGMVVRGWAPQLDILAHAATGAFMSHCGWNSCMESLSMGVPVLAWPMHSDQPMNAMMLIEYLKVGFPVREWARRKDTVTAAEVAEAVKKVTVYDEGKEVKRKVKKLSEEIRGALRADLNSFVAHITR